MSDIQSNLKPYERWQWPKKLEPNVIINLINKHPNDMELGREVRKYVRSLSTKFNF